MLRKVAVFLLIGAFSGAAALLHPGQARADDPVATIRGAVFVDQNGDGFRDEGEPGLEGVEVQFANGEEHHTVATGAEGEYVLPVGPGLWRVSISAPEGYEVQGESAREVQIGEEAADAVLNFTLTALAAAEGEAAAEAEAAETAEELSLLPESGASLPWGVLLAVGLAALSGAGLLLVVVGRRLARG